jgi:uncharacterized RDD family membrane protein YckC
VTQVPAGWYADPDPSIEKSSLRYWDGTAWTAHTAPVTTQAAPAGPTTPDGEPLAGWWWRVLAYVVDSVIVSFVAGFASLPGYLRVQSDLQPVIERFVEEVEANPDEPPDLAGFYADYVDAAQGALQAHWAWLILPTALIATVYWVFFLRWKNATPGKLMLGLRIRLRDEPGRLPWRSIAARLVIQFGVPWAVYAVALASGSLALFWLAATFLLVWLIDPLWATWDPRRQTLHDKLARTNVVRSR